MSKTPLQKKTPLSPYVAREVWKRALHKLRIKKDFVSAVPAGLNGEDRTPWENWVGNQECEPLLVFRPTKLAELQEIVREAVKRKCKVKAIGSGHSWADGGTTSDFMVYTHGLCRELDLERSLLRDRPGMENLVNVEAGIIIKDLNALLDGKGLALPNMGGYTGQTVAGVISTATHGSGIAYGPVAGFVESLTLVDGHGRVLRIEPTEGITDPVQWSAAHPDIILKQDDQWFNAAVVSMGCMGIVYSVLLRVTRKFWLKEVRTLKPWEQVKKDLRERRVLVDNERYEILVSPYKVNGDYTCVITTRNSTPEPRVHDYDRDNRNFLENLIPTIPLISWVFRFLFWTFPDLTPIMIDNGMKALQDDCYIAPSYRVFDIGAPNDIRCYCAEIGIPVEKTVEAVDKILQLAEKMRVVGRVYVTSPFALRFVHPSSAHVAMMNGYETCMIEMPIVDGTYAGMEILRQLEQAMYEFSGRPHWGQVNSFTGNNGFLHRMYPNLDLWLEVYRDLNGPGTFNNEFTERCGFSVPDFVPHKS